MFIDNMISFVCTCGIFSRFAWRKLDSEKVTVRRIVSSAVYQTQQFWEICREKIRQSQINEWQFGLKLPCIRIISSKAHSTKASEWSEWENKQVSESGTNWLGHFGKIAVDLFSDTIPHKWTSTYHLQQSINVSGCGDLYAIRYNRGKVDIHW